MKISAQDLTVVVRSVGERTQNVCWKLIAEQVPEENIVIINEQPFTAAIAKTFEVGLEKKKPWTLCIDADVMLREGAIVELLAMTQHLDDKVFEIQGNVLCKFYGGSRQAGNHLYRTSLLAKALQCIPSNNVLRPETATILQMNSLGFPWIRKEMIVGLHDYEQYYIDIYRKAFIFAHKHRYISIIEPMWHRLAHSDMDYQVALWGLKAGKNFEGEVKIDSRQFPQDIVKLTHFNDKEKEVLLLTQFSGTTINQMILDFQSPPEYWNLQHIKNSSNKKNKIKLAFEFLEKGMQRVRRSTNYFPGKNLRKKNEVSE